MCIPLNISHNPQGGWRPCGDYCRLNDVTTPGRYLISHIQNLSAKLSGNNVFSKIDGGYTKCLYHHQQWFAVYGYILRSFGLKNAAQAFQHLIDTVFQNVDCVFIYLDDILVASCDTDVGARVIQFSYQFVNVYCQPLAFFSKQLQGPEQKLHYIHRC